MLMKLLTACVDGDDSKLAGNENKTFKAYLKDWKLTPNLIHYVLYSIAMSNENTPCLQGIHNTKRFLQSLGRFGKTPFLYSMYGSGEIPQAFCRLSAVFGGIYALNQELNGLIVDENNEFKSIICGTQRITAKHLVIGVDKAPKCYVKNVETDYISRGIFITDKSILESEKEHLTLLIIPPEGENNGSTVIEMGTLTGTCPKDLSTFFVDIIYIVYCKSYILDVVHMTAKRKTIPKEDLHHCVQKLFSQSEDDNRPKVLWSFYCSVPNTNQPGFNAKVSETIYMCPGPDMDLDYDGLIKQVGNHSIYFQ